MATKQQENNNTSNIHKTKAKIVETCIKLLDEKSFTDIHISELCSMIDISVGTFYHHFNSKNGLMIEIFKQFERYSYKYKETYNFNTTDYKIEILEHFEIEATFIIKHGKEFVTHVFSALPAMSEFDFYSVNSSRLAQSILKILEREEKAGTFVSDLSINDILVDLLVIQRSILFFWTTSTEFDIFEHAKQIINNFLIGVETAK